MSLHTSLHSEDIRSDLILSRDIRAEWDWMTVLLLAKPNASGDLRSTLCIHSSFGSFGMSWRERLAPGTEDLRSRIRSQVIANLLDLPQESFLRRIIGEDEDVPDFDASCASILNAIEELLEAEDPHGADAQRLRETFLAVSEAAESIPEDLCDAHRVEMLQGIPEIWEAVPDQAAALPLRQPSRRMRQAMGLYDRLWREFAAMLTLEEGVCA